MEKAVYTNSKKGIKLKAGQKLKWILNEAIKEKNIDE